MFRGKRDRKLVNPFHSKLPLSHQYNVILNHQNPIDLNSELKFVGKFNQFIAQNHINIIVKQMAIKYGELIGQFNFEIKVFANVSYEKVPDDEPIEVINHRTPIELINNLTRLEINDLDVLTRVDHEIQRRKMWGSGWNLQGINSLKVYFQKAML